jgi:hypothetical protein
LKKETGELDKELEEEERKEREEEEKRRKELQVGFRSSSRTALSFHKGI